MKNKILVVIIIGLITVLNSCTSLRTTEQNPQPNILSGQWKMTKWKDLVDLKAGFPVGVPIFLIDAEKGTISSLNGCNQLNGKLRYTSQTATVQFYAITSTRIFCNTEPELELINALSQINKYEVTDSSLFLMVDKEVAMEFERTLGD